MSKLNINSISFNTKNFTLLNNLVPTETPSQEFAVSLVDNFDLLVKNERFIEERMKMAVTINELFSQLGEEAPFGFEHDDIWFGNPYTTSCSRFPIEDPDTEIGEDFQLFRLSFSLDWLGFPMPKGFEDSSCSNDDTRSIANYKKDLQIFIDNIDDPMYPEELRFFVKKASDYGESVPALLHADSWYEVLNFIGSYQPK